MRMLAVCLALLISHPAFAVECEKVEYLGNKFTVCTVNAAQEKLRLFLNDDAGTPFGSFAKIKAAHPDQKLTFAMNAGMYHEQRDPVGLYVENGEQAAGLVKRAGPGNFGLLPNGVFCIRDGRSDVFETLRFAKDAPKCVHASQSGPMLVIDGKLHPRFLVNSTSRYIRNGVGTKNNGAEVIFAISDNRVTFHQFGSFFKDHLKTPNALYFDGNVSQLNAPKLGRSDTGFRLGPIVGILE